MQLGCVASQGMWLLRGQRQLSTLLPCCPACHAFVNELLPAPLLTAQVRISRRRLLDSAGKVFELYAGAKTQLEIEFFNEVGTGKHRA